MIDHINFISLFSPYIIDSFKNDDDFLVVLLIMGAIFFCYRSNYWCGFMFTIYFVANRAYNSRYFINLCFDRYSTEIY